MTGMPYISPLTRLMIAGSVCLTPRTRIQSIMKGKHTMSKKLLDKPYSKEERFVVAEWCVWRDTHKQGNSPGNNKEVVVAALKLLEVYFDDDPSTWMLRRQVMSPSAIGLP